MKLIYKVETIGLDFINRTFLMPSVSLKWIIGYFLGRINITFECWVDISIFVSEVQSSLQLCQREIGQVHEIRKIIEELPEVK